MKWLHEMVGSTDTLIRPLDTTMARHAADVHGATFARGWTDGEIADLMNQNTTFGYAAVPAARSGTGKVPVAGFALARGAAGEAEVLTIAVTPPWQGYGVGRRLMDHLLAHAHHERMEAMFLEVEDTNRPALALYGRLGFAQVGDRPDYYAGKGDDKRGRAIVMRRPIRQATRSR